jgi:nucleotide-binding universal stress UspA family protein
MKTAIAFHPSSILCPVDFSELSNLALKYAAAGARVFDATLVVFHAARFELPAYFTSAQAEALKRQQRDQQKQVKDFLRLHTRKLLGKEAGHIRLQFETADAHPVDATLAAARKCRAGTTESVLRHAPAPVLVVPH